MAESIQYYKYLQLASACCATESQQHLMPYLRPTWCNVRQILFWSSDRLQSIGMSEECTTRQNVFDSVHKLKFWHISPHAFLFKLKWLGRNLQRSETSLQSDRINSERNWVKYILIEYCKKPGVSSSEWSGTISMIYIKSINIAQNCSPDVIGFKQKWVLKVGLKQVCFVKQKRGLSSARSGWKVRQIRSKKQTELL